MVQVMAYRKTQKGDNNQANETASHNRIIMDTGAGFTIFAMFIVALIIGAIAYMWVAHADVLQTLVVATFIGVFVGGWIVLVQLTRRSISHTTTVIAIDTMARSRAKLEANIAVQAENYVLYQDENGILQFRGTVQVTENRHYPAQIEAPKERVDDKTILELWDKGTTARAIEKLLNANLPKDERISYYRIEKVLEAYRPGWNERGKRVVESEHLHEN